MTTKQMFDELLAASKKYIDNILGGYSEGSKEMAAFEKKHMERYSGGAAVDHVLFRLFLRRLNEIYKIDLGDRFLELDEEFKRHLVEYNNLGQLVIDIEQDVSILKQKGIYKVLEELPQEGQVNIIYLVPRQDALDKNIKDEYMWIDGKWESVGTTSIDLADYTTKVEFNEVKQENDDLRKKLAEVEQIAAAGVVL
jgi:hypothetical protein